MTSYVKSNLFTGWLWLLCILAFGSSGDIYAKAPILTKKQANHTPGRVIRTCCSFGDEVKYAGIPFIRRTDIVSIDELGTHYFLGGKHEGNGIIYTREGGFIDVGHLRDYADWTAYLYTQIAAHKDNLKDYNIKLGAEGGRKRLSFNVNGPASKEQCVQIAQSISYDLSLWHEIATYFGVSLIPMVSEQFSSFSPEDVYSNLLGSIIGMLAVESELEYEQAVTAILQETLLDLGAVANKEATQNAMQRVESIWWNRDIPLPNKHFLLKRNYDTAIELYPWLVPFDSESVEKGYPLKKPAQELSELYNLSIKVNEKFPLHAVLSDKKDRYVTNREFSKFVAYIKKKQQRLDEGVTPKTIHKMEKQKKKIAKKSKEE